MDVSVVVHSSGGELIIKQVVPADLPVGELFAYIEKAVANIAYYRKGAKPAESLNLAHIIVRSSDYYD